MHNIQKKEGPKIMGPLFRLLIIRKQHLHIISLRIDDAIYINRTST